MRAAIVLFNRDLRVHDHPALNAAAAEAETVVPLFVFDPAILAGRWAATNRLAFMLDCLRDLDRCLRKIGAGLVVRHGDPVEVVAALAAEVGAAAVFASADVSGYAQRRERRIRAADVDLRLFPGVTVVEPGAVTASGGEHYKVFTPYFRAWKDHPRRSAVDAPQNLVLPDVLDGRVRLPALSDLGDGELSGDLPAGGERAGRALLEQWLDGDVGDYADGHDDLAGDRTSRLSPYLRFGCVSPAEIVERADRRRRGVDAFVRQIAWRDFHYQCLHPRPDASRHDYRTRGDHWRRDDEGLEAWKQGRTGYPLVDAGMRQLRAQGWMHNRARLVAASFLSKELYVDWRAGAQHFADWLVDGDVANNQLNWQWVAGTGTDTRPNRVHSPIRQAERYDRSGDYVRRWLPELADLDRPEVHEPWRLGEAALRQRDYPMPIVDHAEAVQRFRAAREA